MRAPAVPDAEVIHQLVEDPVTAELARRRPDHGGVPAASGLYAWWSRSPTIGDLRLDRFAGSQLWLLYVSSSPLNPGSGQTLRARICNTDLRGGPSQSPLRRNLCALLWQQQHWDLSHRAGRITLTLPSQAALADWQGRHLMVSWALTPRPWLARAAVAKRLGAALNLAEDRAHPNHWLLSEARQRLRSAALAAP